jgi:hypothetical protein
MKIRIALFALLLSLAPAIVRSQTFTVYTSLGKASATYTSYDWLSSYYDVTFENLGGTVFELDFFTFLGYLITIESESPKVKVQWSNTYDSDDYRLLEIKEGAEYLKYDFKSKVQTTMFSTTDSIVAMKEALKAFANGLDATKFKGSGSSYTSTPSTGSLNSTVINNGDKVYLNYPGEMYSTFDLKSNTTAQSTLRGQGLSQTKIDDIASYSEETNWPYGINTLDERTSIRHKFRQYNCYQIGNFDGKVVLEVPYDKNQHMDAGMRPTRTIYFIVGKVGIKPASFYYKEGLPKISITDPGELYSTIDLGASSTAMAAMRSAGMSEPLIQEVLANSTESSWPEGLNTLDERLSARDNIKSFNAYQIAYYDEKVILLIPKEGNRHVPSTMLPNTDMYMVLGTEGLSGVNRYFKRSTVDVAGIKTSAPATTTTSTTTSSGSGGKTWAKAKIYDSGKMYTTYNLSGDATAMGVLYDKGYTQKLIDDILYYANESRWPQGISTLSNWQNNREVVNEYNAYQVASFGDKQILYIPKDQNVHMPQHMQISHDFFMVIGSAGVTISTYSSIPMPSKFQGTAATRPGSSTTSTVTSSSSVTWDLENLSEVKIVNVGRLYSTYNLSTDYDAQSTLKNQAISQAKLDDIIMYSTEKNWPEGINTFADRSGHWEDIARYRVWVVGSFDDKVVLLIPKSKNLHMPPDYRPTRDIYFVIGDDGVK